MRIPDITLKRKIDPGIQDFMDYTMFILNDGLYQFRVLDGEPAWTADNGESVLFSDGTTRRLYFYVDGMWVNITWSGGSSSPICLALVDTDEDTLVEVEKYTDEDKVRFTTAGTLRAVIDEDGLAMTSEHKVIFDGLLGDTYWKYNSVSAYLEGWVDGSKRIEL
jgi:hypothetical protein